MTVVLGQIESLRRLKSSLHRKGIDRFHSVREINDFLKNYESEKRAILNQKEQELDAEIELLTTERRHFEEAYNGNKFKFSHNLSERVTRLKNKYDFLRGIQEDDPIEKTYNAIVLWIQKVSIAFLETNFNLILRLVTYRSNKRAQDAIKKLNVYTQKRQEILMERSLPELKRIAYTREVVNELNSLIAGAIGENRVVRELEKLSDQFTLFNNYFKEFAEPIIYNRDKSRIKSIQIDHVLVGPSGVFLIETKNWSRKSIQNLDFRSPIRQILRTNYAMYASVNWSRDLKKKLKKHHWGERKIPIRNVVVMINQKPRAEFEHVKVLSLYELNNYVRYFEPVFDEEEVTIIAAHLNSVQGYN
jgi:hypothetical protein